MENSLYITYELTTNMYNGFVYTITALDTEEILFSEEINNNNNNNNNDPVKDTISIIKFIELLLETEKNNWFEKNVIFVNFTEDTIHHEIIGRIKNIGYTFYTDVNNGQIFKYHKWIDLNNKPNIPQYKSSRNGVLIIPYIRDQANQTNKFILVKEKYGSMTNKFKFPTGSVDKNEEPKETAFKEIKEELNIGFENIINSYSCGTVFDKNASPDNISDCCFIFLFELNMDCIDKIVIQKTELSAFVIAYTKELEYDEISPFSKKILEYACDKLNGNFIANSARSINRGPKQLTYYF